MNPKLLETVRQLSEYSSFKHLCNGHHPSEPMPSLPVLEEIVRLTRALVFPGYFGNSTIDTDTIAYHTGVNVERLATLLSGQIKAGICFDAAGCPPQDLAQTAGELACTFIGRLPELRRTLQKDVVAAYNGDPAAKSHGEVIFCYPGLKAIFNYRMAHALLQMGVPVIPRIITEMAHSETGIDIHPGAQIGEYFTIDHGTGVVIGETAVIGNNVKMYQGVTLGAKSFPLDKDGNPIKGIQRHPHIGNDVIIYSNASILGNITIGDGAVIGGNIWVDTDVPAGARILQRR